MIKPNKSKVSIVMATFNRAHLIEDTIRNILEQDYAPIEIIVVNDGSSDNTKNLLDRLQASNNLTIIHNDQNLGLQKSLNIGLKKVTGSFIARIDDHDKWIQKDKLSKQVEFLEMHPEIGIVGTGFEIGGKVVRNRLSDADIRKQMLFRCPFCHVTVLIRRSILDQIGGYNETLSYSEDWDLWLRIGKISHLANLEDVSTEVMGEEKSLSKVFMLQQFPLNRKIISKYFKDYPNRYLAFFYHQFIKYFFFIFPLHGKVHQRMQQIFHRTFLSKR